MSLHSNRSLNSLSSWPNYLKQQKKNVFTYVPAKCLSQIINYRLSTFYLHCLFLCVLSNQPNKHHSSLQLNYQSQKQTNTTLNMNNILHQCQYACRKFVTHPIQRSWYLNKTNYVVSSFPTCKVYILKSNKTYVILYFIILYQRSTKI